MERAHLASVAASRSLPYSLVRRIDAFVANYNASARPFAWPASADSILAKLERLQKAISGTQH